MILYLRQKIIVWMSIFWHSASFSINNVFTSVTCHSTQCLTPCIGDPTRYSSTLSPQVSAALAQAFVIYIPTKVSQIWFPEHQRMISTTLLSMGELPLCIAASFMKKDFFTKNCLPFFHLSIVPPVYSCQFYV